MASDSKYNMFRNFMANELGITKDDIKDWTKQAIADRVDKLVGQINVEEVVKKAIRNELSYTRINELGNAAIHNEISQNFNEKYKVTITERK